MSIPFFSLNLDQVRESGLLSPERMAVVEAEMESRFSIPLTPDGRQITTARLIDCGEYGLHLYPVMTHESNWEYARRQLLGCVLTEKERDLLDKQALDAASRRREQERFDQATKVSAVEWVEWVTNGDEYWSTISEYLECVDDQESSCAAYLWATIEEPVIPALDVAGVVENWFNDRGPEDMETDDLNGVAELQAALDAFVKANKTVVSHRPDYTRAIIL